MIEDLHEEYPKSMFMIRDRMKSKLGFTTRNHRHFDVDKGYQDSVYLDFYSEKKRTMFLLKFGQHLTAEQRKGDLV